MNKKFDSVVVISYGAIGDFVMLLYFLVSLEAQSEEKKRYFVLTTTNVKLLRDIAGAYDCIEIVPITFSTLVKLWLQAGLKRNLVVIPPTFTDTPSVVGMIAKIFALRGILAGFVGRAKTPRLDIQIPFETRKRIYELFDALLDRLGYQKTHPPQLHFTEDASLREKISGQYIVVAPFASNPGKSLPPERWQKLFTYLLKTYPDRALVFVGGPKDKGAAQAYMAGRERTYNCCDVPFAQLVSLLKGTSCFIGVDSGLTHVAGVLHVPSVIIDNLRAVTWLPTYNPKAIILTEKKNCVCNGDKTGGDCNYVIDGVSYLRCMYDVSDERIADALAETLAL